MTRTGEKNHVELILLDEPVEVNVDKGKSGTRSPMPKQTILDLLRLQRLAEQWILLQVDHSQAEIIAGAPIDLCVAQFFRTQWLVMNSGSGWSIRCEFLDFGGG